VDGALDDAGVQDAFEHLSSVRDTLLSIPVVFLNVENYAVLSTASGSKYSPDCAIAVLHGLMEHLKLEQGVRAMQVMTSLPSHPT
jgi:hypothetical protein